jgi:hypothetical protein
MKCPSHQEWDLLASEVLEGDHAAGLLVHSETCPACRARLETARRDHVDRVRMYEAFDRGHDELREQLMAALPDESPQPVDAGRLRLVGHRLGGFVMSLNTPTGRRVAVLAPAACILIVIGLLLATGGESAFAIAIEHFKQAKTIVCRITMPEGLDYGGMQIRSEGTLQLSSEFGTYSEFHVNGMLATQHYAPLEGPAILLQPMTRTYMELDADAIDAMSAADRSPDGWLRKLWDLTEDAAVELGTDTIDEHEAVGYRIAGERFGYATPAGSDAEEAYGELWVGAQDYLPVRFLIHIPLADSEMGLTIVFDEFQWDVALDPGLFEVEIPEGFVKLDARLVNPTEETLLGSLARVRELTGGRYTSTLQPVGLIAELRAMLTDEAKAKTASMDRKEVMQLGLEVSAGGIFYMELVKEGREPEYFGETVTADDADQVLLRWTLDDGQVRVIYGDLSVQTLPAQ